MSPVLHTVWGVLPAIFFWPGKLHGVSPNQAWFKSIVFQEKYPLAWSCCWSLFPPHSWHPATNTANLRPNHNSLTWSTNQTCHDSASSGLCDVKDLSQHWTQNCMHYMMLWFSNVWQDCLRLSWAGTYWNTSKDIQFHANIETSKFLRPIYYKTDNFKRRSDTCRSLWCRILSQAQGCQQATVDFLPNVRSDSCAKKKFSIFHRL